MSQNFGAKQRFSKNRPTAPLPALNSRFQGKSKQRSLYLRPVVWEHWQTGSFKPPPRAHFRTENSPDCLEWEDILAFSQLGLPWSPHRLQPILLITKFNQIKSFSCIDEAALAFDWHGPCKIMTVTNEDSDMKFKYSYILSYIYIYINIMNIFI